MEGDSTNNGVHSIKPIYNAVDGKGEETYLFMHKTIYVLFNHPSLCVYKG
jgi:hypothetical protein